MVFSYYHTIAWDLSRYNVFSSFEQEQVNRENSLHKALRLSGIPNVEKFIHHLEYNMSLSKACALHDITIHCRVCNEKADSIWTQWYNKKDKNSKLPVYRLGCINGHWLVNDRRSGLTMYSVINYHKIKNEPDWNTITLKHRGYKGRMYYHRHKRSDKRQIDAFRVVKLLLRYRNDLLIPVVNAEHLTSTQVSYTCPFCSKLHWHGNGDIKKIVKKSFAIHRVCHCDKGTVYVRVTPDTLWVRTM